MVRGRAAATATPICACATAPSPQTRQRYSFLLGARDAGWAGHILTVDGEPAVVSAMAIVPSVDANVLQGEPHLMVSVVKIDEDFMVGVGRTLLMPDLTVVSRATNAQRRRVRAVRGR